MQTREAAQTPTQEEIIALAERLAKHEGFAPSWITYPRWAGSAVDFAPILKKADKFKEWAKAILTKTLPPPPWLAEEDPAFRDPDLNKPSTNPNKLPNAKRRALEHKRFACRIALQTPLPSQNALPKPKRPPTEEEIIDLAIRLDGKMLQRHFPKFFYQYPKWAGHPPHYDQAMQEVAHLKQQAEAILKGEERPPPWLVRKEPERWTPKQGVKTAPAPTMLSEADAHLQRQAYPLLAAWIMLATSPSPPPTPARPPPLPAVWFHPHCTEGDPLPVLPALWQQETRSISLDLLFDNRIAVMRAA